MGVDRCGRGVSVESQEEPATGSERRRPTKEFKAVLKPAAQKQGEVHMLPECMCMCACAWARLEEMVAAARHTEKAERRHLCARTLSPWAHAHAEPKSLRHLCQRKREHTRECSGSPVRPRHKPVVGPQPSSRHWRLFTSIFARERCRTRWSLDGTKKEGEREGINGREGRMACAAAPSQVSSHSPLPTHIYTRTQRESQWQARPTEGRGRDARRRDEERWCRQRASSTAHATRTCTASRQHAPHSQRQARSATQWRTPTARASTGKVERRR